MMNKLSLHQLCHRSLLLLASCSLLTLLPACQQKSNQDPLAQVMRLQIVSSDHSFSPAGGAGKVLFSEEGFTATADVPWIKLGASQGKQLSFTIEPYTETETRTGNIRYTKDGQTAQLAITQLGAYNYFTDIQRSYSVDRHGKEILLPYLSQTGDVPVVEGAPSWITSRSDAEGLHLSVAPLTEAERSTSLKLKLGPIYDTSITIQQSYGELEYDELIGTYTATYIPVHEDQPQPDATTTLTIEAKDKATNLLTLKGLAADVELSFDPATSTLTVNYQTGQQTLDNGERLCFTLWGYNFPKADGSKNQGLSWQNELRMRASWDRASTTQLGFQFSSPTTSDGVTYRGLVFWRMNAQGRFAGFYRANEAGAIFGVADLRLQKQ